jgi:hypothetical protein
VADAITVEHAEASRDSGRRDDPVPANRPINMNDAGISSVDDSGVLRQDTRRGHGEGSVYRDAANGTWVGAISLGWRPDGSRIRRKVTGRSKTEVREKL